MGDGASPSPKRGAGSPPSKSATGNNGNAGEPSGNWCLGPSNGALVGVRQITIGKIVGLYMLNPAI